MECSQCKSINYKVMVDINTPWTTMYEYTCKECEHEWTASTYVKPDDEAIKHIEFSRSFDELMEVLHG